MTASAAIAPGNAFDHATSRPALRLTGGPRDDDDALVRAARAGDRAALGRLHDRFAPVVHGVLLARVPPTDADDLVQEVFLHAMGKLHTLRDDDAVGPWLITITRRFAARFHRRRRPHAALREQPDGRAPDGLGAARRAEAHRILDAIRALPDAYAETLTLRLVAGLSGPQIATRTGMTPGSVRVNLHRGMRLLRERLGLDEEREEEAR